MPARVVYTRGGKSCPDFKCVLIEYFSQQVSEGEKVSGRQPLSDARNTAEKKLPTQATPPNSAPPQVGGASDRNTVAQFPPQAHTSHTTPDESTSEEITNGAPPTNPAHSSANAAPVPYFFGHPMGPYLILPEGRTPVAIPNHQSGMGMGPQVASVQERPLMHAPIPQPLQPHPPRPVGDGERENVNPQLPQRDSAKRGEAWPMVGEDDAQQPPGDQPSPPPGPLPPRYLFPFGIPAPSEQGIPIMRPTHLPTIPPGGPAPPRVPVSLQHMFPFFITPHHPPVPAHLPRPLEIETDSKEVQTSPPPSPVVPHSDREVQVCPSTSSVGVQCAWISRREGGTNTEPQGVDQLLVLSEDIKPPSVSAQAYLLSGDIQGQIRVLTEYAEQVSPGGFEFESHV